jgi:hypothetical protein
MQLRALIAVIAETRWSARCALQTEVDLRPRRGFVAALLLQVGAALTLSFAPLVTL